VAEVAAAQVDFIPHQKATRTRMAVAEAEAPEVLLVLVVLLDPLALMLDNQAQRMPAEAAGIVRAIPADPEDH
jgi:hypothetical protein